MTSHLSCHENTVQHRTQRKDPPSHTHQPCNHQPSNQPSNQATKPPTPTHPTPPHPNPADPSLSILLPPSTHHNHHNHHHNHHKTNGEPTLGNHHVHDVNTPNWPFWRKKWQSHGETRYSPSVACHTFGIFAACQKKSLRFFFWGLLPWMLYICRARHPGPGNPLLTPSISIEFLNLRGWLANGDLALESQAHFFWPLLNAGCAPCQSAKCYCTASATWYFVGLGPRVPRCHSWWPRWGRCRQLAWSTPLTSVAKSIFR